MSSDRAKKLKALKERRQLKVLEENEENDIYDLVSHDEYRQKTRERVMEDSFVVEDGGEGYAETGAYEWEDGEHNYYSDEEEMTPSRRDKKSKVKEEKIVKQDGNIAKLFRSAPKPKPKPVATLSESVDVNDLISGLGDTAPSRTSSVKRKLGTPFAKRRDLSPPSKKRFSQERTVKSEPVADDFDDFQPASASSPPNVPSSPAAAAADRLEERETDNVKAEPMDVDEESDDDDLKMKPLAAGSAATKKVNLSAVKAQKVEPAKPKSPEISPAKITEDTTSWLDVGANIINQSQDIRNSAKFEEIVDNDEFKFFWTDYEEKNGQLFLFGKAKSKNGDKFTSCVIRLTDLYRTVHALINDDEEGEEQEEIEVYNELQEILRKHGVEKSFCKPEKKKYCFELEDVPKGERTYMTAVIPINSRIDWEHVKRTTFGRVFGSTKSAFEEFVVSKGIMGPCWLNVKGATELPNASWCQITASVSIDKGFESSDAISVVPDADNMPPPPLTVMALSIRTVVGSGNKQEVMAISGRVYQNMAHDTTKPANEISSILFTEVRPIDKMHPSGFDKELEKESTKHTTSHKTEASLLRRFVTLVQNYDPDVIIGHDLVKVHLSVICHRLKENDIKFWDKMGRLRQSKWPNGFGTSAYELHNIREVLSGRLLCDLTNEMGQSMTTNCASWSLTEMCELYLNEKRSDVDINAAKCSWNKDAQGLVRFLAHNEVDVYYIAALTFRIQILALSKQLTNLAGNAWATTLAGSRVNRNEFILLHEFTKQGYIVPDKTASNKRGQTKDKFKGGMVLDPEKGLHKDIVLVMDFNSLYPSVIQEYNICFTTVDRSKCKSAEDPAPDPPAKDVPMGIFPQLVQNLVVRRREVKKLVKTATNDIQRAQWDIKQLALKLTANSMYGCLGFQGSRFYALPLAMLTTQMGREALKATKDLAEDQHLHVVYGDTDSVMINTNSETFKEAMRIGDEFKKIVNQQYKHLEIDIDNVFRRILLTAKKRYAAMVMIEKPDGTIQTKMEVKGLDMKRREYCQLSKDASVKVLEEILNQDDIDVAGENIFAYAEELAQKVRDQEIPVGKFVIRTGLNKDPETYSNSETMPAVQLALRRKQNGEIVKAGDVMQYVIVAGDGPVASRATTVQEFQRNADLKLDAEFYLSHQVFPPLERLLTNVDGAELSRLADSLGVDKSFRTGVQNEGYAQDRDIQPLESTIPDKERFANAERLNINCASCSKAFQFEGVNADSVTATGIKCGACGAHVVMTRVNAQLEIAIRRHIAKYYAGWLVCDDPSCKLRTRHVNVYGRRCTGQEGDCRGTVRYEYSDKELYNQLLYLDSIFDMDRVAANQAGGAGEDLVKIKALAEQNRMRFAVPRSVVAKYLTNCGRRYVDMNNIFGFM